MDREEAFRDDGNGGFLFAVVKLKVYTDILFNYTIHISKRNSSLCVVGTAFPEVPRSKPSA